MTGLRTQLKGANVKVKYHPSNLSRIHIFDPFQKKYIPVPAVDREYAEGLSLWQHRVIRAEELREAKQVDERGIAEAKRKMRQVAEESKKKQKLANRKRKAREEGIGTQHSLEGRQAQAPAAPPSQDAGAVTPTLGEELAEMFAGPDGADPIPAGGQLAAGQKPAAPPTSETVLPASPASGLDFDWGDLGEEEGWSVSQNPDPTHRRYKQ